ncbi:MAG: type II toxin-antitoxin system HicA family toxin [Defluviitaleaceae bacterium]|nr:type II toxin-antitoxin system HicA family toxin [Defluviitaleaceae bacterium]
MGKSEKLLSRLSKSPKDFTFGELETLLTGLGFELSNVGGTSGSAVRFKHPETGQILRLHKPHPSPILKEYLVKAVVTQLKLGGYLHD